MTTSVMSRPASTRIPAVLSDCFLCFGTGKVFVKPGVYAPCPNGCTGYILAAAALWVPAAPVRSGYCAGCGCASAWCAGGCGCGCGACGCSYCPTTAVTGGAR